MLDARVISLLPKLPPTILTVYLDTNPANPRNQRWPSGARIWLKARAQAVRAGMARQEERLFRKQVERVERFLVKRPKRERGIAVYAGPQAWHVLRLQVGVGDELHWGRASLKQLLWLLDEHQPCGVAVVDHSGARFYRFWMGEVEEQKASRFQVDTSQWRKKRLVRPGRTGKQKAFSAHKDAFEQRLPRSTRRSSAKRRPAPNVGRARRSSIRCSWPAPMKRSSWSGPNCPEPSGDARSL